MQNRIIILFVGLIVMAKPVALAQATFPDDLLLIGVKTRDAADLFSVRNISRDGQIGGELYRTDKGAINSGRLDHSRGRLAMGVSSGRISQLWILGPAGNATHIAEGGPKICAWSPDSKTLTYTRGLDGFQLNVAAATTSAVELPKDYVMGDWHPRQDIQMAVFLNRRNHVYREFRGDRYPLRQIDLIQQDGRTSPITKNPSSDNIWPRFSPDGSRIAHYQRVLFNEVPHETLVVCGEDGSDPVTLVDLRKIGAANHLPWFRPKGSPVWSPDGKTIAWLVNTNERETGDGEKFEVLFVDVASKKFDRISLTDKGVTWVSEIEW